MLDPLKLADALDAEGELHLPEGGGKISAEAFAAIVRALRELGAKPDDPADGGVKDDLDVGRIAFHALRALRPGDVVPAGVVVPQADAVDPYLAGFRACVKTIESLGVHVTWGLNATPDDGLREGLAAAKRAAQRSLDRLQEPPHD